MSRLSGIGKQPLAIALGAILLVLILVIGVTSGFGKENVPDDAVAIVDGDEITMEEFDKAVEQAAKQQSLPQPPEPGSPEFDAVRDQAMNDLLDIAWIQGEAAEQGVEVSDREVQEEFEQTKEESFKTEKEYEDFLEQSGFTQEDVDLRVELQLLSTKIQEKITEEQASVSEKDAEEFYEANKEQFQQPESRNVRFVLNDDEEKAQEAFDELSADNSPENWDKVAKDLSTDQATKDKGGLQEGITEGTFDPALDAAVFDAPQGEVEGPVDTPQGFYVFQVDEITEARTVPLDEARAQIDQQLAQQLQQEAFGSFLSDYRDRWTEVTVCADDFLTERCDNFGVAAQPCPDPSLPEEQQQQQLEQAGCPPPVQSSSPGAPGSFLPFIPAQAAPQRPHPPGEDAAPTGLPPGAVPGGVPGGAPGAAPPGGAAAPPQGAPQQAAP